jgi:hypothetical protein
MFNLFSVQEDGSKVLLASFSSLADAQAAMTDSSVTYSIEQFIDPIVTVIQ